LIEACDADVKPVSMRLSQVNILKPARLLVKTVLLVRLAGVFVNSINGSTPAKTIPSVFAGRCFNRALIAGAIPEAGEWPHFTLSVFGIILRLVFERINAWQPSGMPPPDGLSGQSLCMTVPNCRQTSEAAFKRSFFE
jgi:hypothetical protein